MNEAFGKTLKDIVEVAVAHPAYNFELIQSYISELRAASDEAGRTAWQDKLNQQFAELTEPRQQACQDLFTYALRLARQATYTPVNDLDVFLEKQIYGVQDDQAINKGLVSQVLKAAEQAEAARKRPPVQPPQRGTGPVKPQSAALTPQQRAGRTNPLPPVPGRPPEG